jgi:hypothetical protein
MAQPKKKCFPGDIIVRTTGSPLWRHLREKYNTHSPQKLIYLKLAQVDQKTQKAAMPPNVGSPGTRSHPDVARRPRGGGLRNLRKP